MSLGDVERVFSRRRAEGRAVLVPYLMAGYPDLSTSDLLLRTVAKSGADIIEIGIPYSDPLADGPAIQKAGQGALASGTNTDHVLELVALVRPEIGAPLVLMTYYNTIVGYGVARFAARARETGVDGVIVPDLPPEEAGPWLEVSRANQLAAILLVAPTSSTERLRLIAERSTGFVYCVSLTGVTGVRERLPSGLPEFLKRVRSVTNAPLAVGFGVSSPERAAEVAALADGVIIGSALINLIIESPADCVARVGNFIASVRRALDDA